MPRRVLIVFAHPVLERSRVNRRLMEAVRDLPGVTVDDLYEEYPTLGIDVGREQARLLAHDVIVLQHPFYWYSAPAIVKEWLDLVLTHGWAYGHGGTALKGKIIFNAVSTAGGHDAYHAAGYNRFTMRQLLAPFDQTAYLCGMRYLAPFVVHGALRLVGDRDLRPRADGYVRLIEALRDDRLDLVAAQTAESLDDLDPLISPGGAA